MIATPVTLAVALAVWIGATPGATAKKPATATPAATPAPARPKLTDFSGRWTLDMKRSEFGKLPRPVARTDEIAHREPEIRHVLHLLNGSQRDTARYHYRTGGEVTHSTIDGRDVQSVAKWEGNDLRIDSKTKLMVFEVSLSERWTLSTDARTLTMTRHVKSPLMSGDQKLIFTKE